MKQTILALAAGCILTTWLTAPVSAQDAAFRNAMVKSHSAKPAAGAGSTIPSSANSDAGMAINAKAIHHFKDRYADAREEKWIADKNGFVVLFNQDGFRNRAYYDRKGRWQYSLSFRPESKLPREIRNVVKRTYFDYAISLVEVVEIPEHLVYLVHLEDAREYKIVRVSEEGEMDVMQEFTKS
jgi:hypothetical protein